MEGTAYPGNVSVNQDASQLSALSRDLIEILGNRGYPVTDPQEAVTSLWSSIGQTSRSSTNTAAPRGMRVAKDIQLPCGTVIFPLDTTTTKQFSIKTYPSKQVTTFISSTTRPDLSSSCIGSITHGADEPLCSSFQDWCAEHFDFNVPRSIVWFRAIGEIYLSTDILPSNMLHNESGFVTPAEAPTWVGWASLKDLISTSGSCQSPSDPEQYQPDILQTQQALMESGAALYKVLDQISAIKHKSTGSGTQDVNGASTCPSRTDVKSEEKDEDEDDSDLFGLSYFKAK